MHLLIPIEQVFKPCADITVTGVSQYRGFGIRQMAQKIAGANRRGSTSRHSYHSDMVKWSNGHAILIAQTPSAKSKFLRDGTGFWRARHGIPIYYLLLFTNI
jgi:hypothetical protein